ncbi:MAG: YifB family Mg chelatase-like AAA ATPase [Candidatus Margulisbacteria bacterium]|nr:YifB family Mg chelatase-like AAA ATPase [Candidatus Margulisiibacteriota bacterium]
MLSRIYSVAACGIEPVLVDCEVDSRNGLPSITIVGLPDTVVKESKERVISAIKNSGYQVPINKSLTINLAPAEVRKVGAYYDLPIAIAVLVSTGQLSINIAEKFMMIGELGLDGRVKAVQGVLLVSILAKEKDIKYVFVPKENAEEASLVEDVQVVAISTLTEVIDILASGEIVVYQRGLKKKERIKHALDFSEVKGQGFAKRAGEIAASGGHNFFLIGPPGCGKSMIAKRFPSILPDLSEEEALDVIKIHSVSGKTKRGSIFKSRPFRSPHHTISYAGLIGGTSSSKPGEVSLAHKGVLFLDEILEFDRKSLESLRQPMEDGEVTVARASNSYKYPASFILVASANPCPCGYSTHPTVSCTCNGHQKLQYFRKMSGPLIDRFDLVVEMSPVSEDDLLSTQQAEPSCDIQKRVESARNIQRQRFAGKGITLNAEMSDRDIGIYCKVAENTTDFIRRALKRYSLSGRALNRLLKVARTIADLESNENIKLEHVLEAFHFRRSIENV